MRGFLQEVLLEFQSTAGQEHDNAFNRSFFRMYRLLSNLDFMRGMDSPSGTPFHPITLDLAGLCRPADGGGRLSAPAGRSAAPLPV